MNSVPYTQPQFKLGAFHCPYCSAFANFFWEQLGTKVWNGDFSHKPIFVATCTHCSEPTYWVREENTWCDAEDPRDYGRMILPATIAAPMAHASLPDECTRDFNEAREVAAISPRSAAALLRLCLQRLCVHLGQPGKNINDDIGALVKEGLPVEIQQALDIVRITGNNAVHPGEMSLDDNPEIVYSLFGLINLIIDNRIEQPKRVASFFAALPGAAQAAVATRDRSKT